MIPVKRYTSFIGVQQKSQRAQHHIRHTTKVPRQQQTKLPAQMEEPPRVFGHGIVGRMNHAMLFIVSSVKNHNRCFSIMISSIVNGGMRVCESVCLCLPLPHFGEPLYLESNNNSDIEATCAGLPVVVVWLVFVFGNTRC